MHPQQTEKGMMDMDMQELMDKLEEMVQRGQARATTMQKEADVTGGVVSGIRAVAAMVRKELAHADEIDIQEQDAAEEEPENELDKLALEGPGDPEDD